MAQASNEALAAEKTRMDVLLARQYNLISCMAEQGGLNNGRRGNSLEEKTLGEAGCADWLLQKIHPNDMQMAIVAVRHVCCLQDPAHVGKMAVSACL